MKHRDELERLRQLEDNIKPVLYVAAICTGIILAFVAWAIG